MKKYKMPEENLEGTMVQEPAAYPRMRGQDTAVLARDSYGVNEEDIDDVFTSSPFASESIEDVVAYCDEAMSHRNDPSCWISEEEFNHRLYEKYPWLK